MGGGYARAARAVVQIIKKSIYLDESAPALAGAFCMPKKLAFARKLCYWQVGVFVCSDVCVKLAYKLVVLFFRAAKTLIG